MYKTFLFFSLLSILSCVAQKRTTGAVQAEGTAMWIVSGEFKSESGSHYDFGMFVVLTLTDSSQSINAGVNIREVESGEMLFMRNRSQPIMVTLPGKLPLWIYVLLENNYRMELSYNLKKLSIKIPLAHFVVSAEMSETICESKKEIIPGFMIQKSKAGELRFNNPKTNKTETAIGSLSFMKVSSPENYLQNNQRVSWMILDLEDDIVNIIDIERSRNSDRETWLAEAAKKEITYIESVPLFESKKSDLDDSPANFSADWDIYFPKNNSKIRIDWQDRVRGDEEVQMGGGEYSGEWNGKPVSGSWYVFNFNPH